MHKVAKMDEGVIKFNYILSKTGPLADNDYLDLEKWRVILYRMKLIGEYQTEKLGYGNLSKRAKPGTDEFIISGTQTGRFANLDGQHYTHVTKGNFDKMSIEAQGPIAPSSESLTHLAIYSACPQIHYIFHVHHTGMWDYMIKNNKDATDENVGYGTKEMAREAKNLIGGQNQGIFVMKGHQDGIISYGASAEEAGRLLLEMHKEAGKATP
jgi:ribulose-5-phosphate 4-epimerase/fuculose-1-phosphate aldolase